MWTVVALAAAPALLHWCGLDFSTVAGEVAPTEIAQWKPAAGTQVFATLFRGPFVHTILEWSAFCVALVTVVLAFVHYQVKGDTATPIIGAALFFPGMIDAFNTLAADRLIDVEANMAHFIPFTWTISRTLNAGIMFVGALIPLGRRAAAGTRPAPGVGWLLSLGVLYGVLAYLVVQGCARLPQLPEMYFPRSLAPRPWDALPLVLFLLATIVLPRFSRQHPGLFAHALVVSLVPHIAAQLHGALGSTELFDNHFNSACFLKVLAYLVPLAGLILDYTRVTQAEESLKATEVELRVARELQRDLLPRVPPTISGFDVAGISHAAVAVGGDYFDFVPMTDGRWGIVVADVSGHDIGASIFMAQTRAYLRALSQSQSNLDALCADLNGCLLGDSQDRRFVTLFLTRLDPARNVFDFAAAGHIGYLITAAGEVRMLEAEGIPLGVMDHVVWRAGPEQPLAPGDLVLAMTDGIHEAESAGGAQFGPTRALEVISSQRHKPARDMVAALHQAVREFCGPAGPADDLTIVVLKRNATLAH